LKPFIKINIIEEQVRWLKIPGRDLEVEVQGQP
jgi:hypothetical protein